MVTCCTALCWGLGLSSLSSSSLGAGMMLDSQVEAVITFSLLPALAWACAARAGAEFSLSLESSPLVTCRAGGWGSQGAEEALVRGDGEGDLLGEVDGVGPGVGAPAPALRRALLLARPRLGAG